jgi:hypothetical protein
MEAAACKVQLKKFRGGLEPTSANKKLLDGLKTDIYYLRQMCGTCGRI